MRALWGGRGVPMLIWTLTAVAWSGSGAAAAGIVIDSFDTDQAVGRTGVGTATGTVGGVSTAIIGGERDVLVTVTSGTGTLNVDANLSLAGGLSHASAGLVRGTALITYDGNDNDAATLDATGLGGVDLTNGGADNLLYVSLPFADLGASIRVTVYSDATRCSTLSQAVPGGVRAPPLPRALLFPFASFSQGAGCTGTADFTSAGAVTLLIDGTSIGATDLSLELFATGVADLGDLPSGFMNTTLADSGAAHVICTGLKLGAEIDGESDGQESTDATADDMTGTPDDEDGVVITPASVWTVGTPTLNGGKVDVTVMGDGCLSAWLDWNGDNDFDDPGESILGNVVVSTGSTTQSFAIPAGVVFPNTFFARFRLYPRDDPGGTNNCVSPRAPILQYVCGEVEDYRLAISAPPTPTATQTPTITSTPTPTFTPTIAAVCGNGIPEPGEVCDDGNRTDGDGCDSNCTPTGCGNGVVTGSEQCDDGNFENLDGCEADCTPSPCLKTGGRLIPGYCNSKKNDCILEFCTAAAPVPTFRFHGLPNNLIVCTDDDPSCDSGTAGDRACTFRVALCFNVNDPRFTCRSSGAIERVRFRRPNKSDAISVANRDALEAAVKGLGGVLRVGPGVPAQRIIEFNPPLTAPNVCTGFADITVPIRHNLPTKGLVVVLSDPPKRPGVRKRDKHDSDILALVCAPK
jgi:cysteine-rich repeat protein